MTDRNPSQRANRAQQRARYDERGHDERRRSIVVQRRQAMKDRNTRQRANDKGEATTNE